MFVIESTLFLSDFKGLGFSHNSAVNVAVAVAALKNSPYSKKSSEDICDFFKVDH